MQRHIPENYLETLKEKERRLTLGGIMMDPLRKLAKKSGLDTEKGVWPVVEAHKHEKVLQHRSPEQWSRHIFYRLPDGAQNRSGSWSIFQRGC